MKNTQTLREEFAEIEHEQWITWSKNIAKSESITPARLEHWKLLWKPYNELTEAEKDQDREWGDKGLALLDQALKEQREEIRREIEKIRKPIDKCSEDCPLCGRGLRRKCQQFEYLDMPNKLVEEILLLPSLQEPNK